MKIAFHLELVFTKVRICLHMAAVRSLVVLQVEGLVIKFQKGTSVGQQGVVKCCECCGKSYVSAAGTRW